MDKADQKGAQMFAYFYKYFLVICHINCLTTSVGNAFCLKLFDGHIDPDKLYHIYRYKYA